MDNYIVCPTVASRVGLINGPPHKIIEHHRGIYNNNLANLRPEQNAAGLQSLPPPSARLLISHTCTSDRVMLFLRGTVGDRENHLELRPPVCGPTCPPEDIWADEVVSTRAH